MFKVGDWVRVKSNLTDKDKNNQCIGWAEKMNVLCGHVFEVKFVDGKFYKLEGAQYNDVNGDGYWLFVDDWLEPEESCDIKEINESEMMVLFK